MDKEIELSKWCTSTTWFELSSMDNWIAWNSWNPNETKEFFQESIQTLEATDWIERYAWFDARRSLDSDLGIDNRIINDEGQLSDL